jgi:16S rRNA (cytidine1402-2'-O)-methyltransferase
MTKTSFQQIPTPLKSAMPGPTAAIRKGTLYVVATPIGNLEDITLRALKILKAVNLVAAEDTRRTAILLRHYDIGTPVLSVHEHNESRRAASLIPRLAAGESIALVTDAGTPAVSDPGAYLVAAAREAGIPIEPIPGPSAVLAALSASGLSSEGFVFAGFPPNRLNTRKRWLGEVIEESSRRTVVLFESPHRLATTLDELLILGERQIMVCRELTKLHEEIRFGTPADHAAHFSSPRGEFTIVIPKAETPPADARVFSDGEVAEEFGQITAKWHPASRREAVKRLADKLGMPVKEVYASLERAKLG